MCIPGFDAFIAVDWSGALARYTGIAVAKCKAGTAAPFLVSPEKGSHWTRTEIARWLGRQLDRGEHLLIGLDFAFGLPFEDGLGYLAGKALHISSVFDLWNLIEEQSEADPDFGCSTFIGHSNYAPLFWKSGSRPAAWVERKRHTELVCASNTRTHPDTVYKLLGSKQVGKASLTGIRVLNHVRSNRTNRVSIWPFHKAKGSVLVEIYPTLFRKTATGSVAKLRSFVHLNRALENVGSRPVAMSGLRPPSDHETDALLSAAGLRRFAEFPDTWSLREFRSQRIRREGWIFGVEG